MHSRIRANISPNVTAENIIKQAYIVADRDPLFKDTYNKTRHYPYTQTTLDFLSKKTTTLGEEVDLRYLPTAYNTSRLPKLESCDACGFPLNNSNSAILTCSHGYHLMCYSGRCIYCENFYKDGIFENVNSFLKRLEKGADILTQEELDNAENDFEEEEELEEVESEKMDVSSLLVAAINNIES
ncbi:hypothetical protein Glove_11g62 [Diversispora epigaea]|uniref:Uncharacterized protein n=1 Tax=Diversispora epigaea TaxID=1348612 RepID=A0A397JWS4_9GLOM|nr:hypothetical protein Glove_11g62 [Diversispora epigaea]